MNDDDTPVRGWIAGWTEFFTDTLPTVFVVVVIAFGLIVMVRRGDKKKQVRGGMGAAIAFALAAALVYLLLTNVDDIAGLFRDELPVGP